MPLRRGKGDFEICCYPGAFVLEDPSFLADTRGRLEEMFANDASFPIRTDQPGGVELARCFGAIEDDWRVQYSEEATICLRKYSAQSVRLGPSSVTRAQCVESYPAAVGSAIWYSAEHVRACPSQA